MMVVVNQDELRAQARKVGKSMALLAAIAPLQVAVSMETWVMGVHVPVDRNWPLVCSHCKKPWICDTYEAAAERRLDLKRQLEAVKARHAN